MKMAGLILAGIMAAVAVAVVVILDRAFVRALKRGDDEWRSRW